MNDDKLNLPHFPVEINIIKQSQAVIKILVKHKIISGYSGEDRYLATWAAAEEIVNKLANTEEATNDN